MLGRSQMIRDPVRFIVSEDLESTSLVNMSSQRSLHSANYQTDSLIHNIEIVSLPYCITHKFSFSKYRNYKNSTGGEGSHKAPDKVLQNKISKVITVVSPRWPIF